MSKVDSLLVSEQTRSDSTAMLKRARFKKLRFKRFKVFYKGWFTPIVLERVREWHWSHTGRECPRQHTEHVMMMKTMVEVVRWA